jgi:hypothetical protein
VGIRETLGHLLARRLEDRPIFVVGGGRSGTSVLVQALGKHRNIYAFAGEDPFLTDIGGMMYNLEFADERELAYYRNSLRIPHGHIYAALKRLSFESAFGPGYGFRSMVRDTRSGAFNPLTKTHWCVKTFPVESVARGLLRLYPNAKFILIHRSGIDVVNSRTQFHGFRELDFRKQCEEWAQNVEDFSYLMEFEPAISVRHADLLEEPEAVFRKIQSFLGVGYDGTPAAFAQTTQIHPLNTVSNETNIDVKARMANRPQVFDTWSQEQQAIFREICSVPMARLGYSLPDYPIKN